jgi:hypothetical protein
MAYTAANGMRRKPVQATRVHQTQMPTPTAPRQHTITTRNVAAAMPHPVRLGGGLGTEARPDGGGWVMGVAP